MAIRAKLIGRTDLKNIQDRFNFNIKRINRLIELYTDMGDVARKTHGADLLRAASVLLHATLEDVLRNLVRWKLPQKRKAMLDVLNYPTDKRKEKCSVSELVDLYPDKTVLQIATDAFEHYLNHLNWNNRKDISDTVTMLGLKAPKDAHLLYAIDELMKRRHLIVHQGDRGEHDEYSHGKLRAIDAEDVTDWLNAVEKYISAILFSEHPLVKKGAKQ